MADDVTNAIDFNDIKQSVEESLGRAPEGWSYLVTTLFTEIKEHCDQKDATYPFILQIKEKLGELRIYHRCDDRHIQSMITATIARANRTFERCSNAAETQLLDGWYTTLCVRRQGFWDRWLPELREDLAHLVGLIMRRICGEASA